MLTFSTHLHYHMYLHPRLVPCRNLQPRLLLDAVLRCVAGIMLLVHLRQRSVTSDLAG